jgi:predicted GTPase
MEIKMAKQDVFKSMENEINSSNLDEATKRQLFNNIAKLKGEKVNLMITGATGSGKSSTINALFDMEVAKVGVGVDPETMEITKYELDNLILWDSPGLGDGKEKDRQHSKGIIKKLNELDKNGNPLIDLVLVILDGSTRDLGTSYELINQVIIPHLGKNPEERVLVAINQADVAMKGRYWNYEKNRPEKKLEEFLDEKVQSVRRRIKEGTGVNIEPIYYSAGFKEDGESQKPYNLSKLLYFIVKNTPTDKRLIIADRINKNKKMWEIDDRLKNYGREIQKSFQEVATKVAGGVTAGAAVGAAIGSFIPVIGTTIGAVVGGVLGGVASFFGF